MPGPVPVQAPWASAWQIRSRECSESGWRPVSRGITPVPSASWEFTLWQAKETPNDGEASFEPDSFQGESSGNAASISERQSSGIVCRFWC